MGMKGRYESIHLHQMMVSEVKPSSSLQMTDYFFLFSLFLMLFWAVDPLLWGLDGIPGIKRLPSIMLAMNLAFIAIGRLMFRNRHDYLGFWTIVRSLRYLVAFSALVTAGSIVAKYAKGIEETFLTMGLFTMVAPITYWYVANSTVPMKLLRAVLVVFTFWALVAAGLQVGFFQKVEIFHNKEHLVLPALATLLYFSPWTLGRPLAVAAVVAVAVATNKNTAYILAAFVCAYLLSTSFYRRWRLLPDPVVRVTWLLAFVVAAGAAAAAVAAGYRYFYDHMPSGNPEYRLHTYGLAWAKFLASPVWGNGFTDAAVVFFDRYDVAATTQYLPTHSDPLDILGNGGLLGMALWLMAIVPTLWRGFTGPAPLKLRAEWVDNWVHNSFLLMSATALVVCMFNPVYNVPNLATANWMVFGCLLASSRERARQQETRHAK